MDKDILSNLRFRRQFILSPVPLETGGNFIAENTGDSYLLNYHADLPFVRRDTPERSLFILGNVFNAFHTEEDNADIAGHLLQMTFNDIVRACDDFSGRYMIIYRDNKIFRLFHDFMSHFKVYWAQKDGKCWCASQPHVLAAHLNISHSDDGDKNHFFSDDKYVHGEYSGLLHHTHYDGIEHLQPNHWLDLRHSTVKRYWPVAPVIPAEKSDVIPQSCDLLSGYLKSAARRYTLMIPVTAGFDSRALFAASREVSQQSIYYINKISRLNDNSADIRVPQKLLSSVGLELHVNTFPPDVDPDFEKVYLQNAQNPMVHHMPLIYQVYYRKFPDDLNIPANGAEAILYRWWDNFDNAVGPSELAMILTRKQDPFAIRVFDEWLKETRPLSREFNIDLSNLFYIEYRMANWATNFQVNKNIAQDEFFPFNSRKLISLLLSVDPYYRQVNSRLLLIRMMKHMWEESLSQPFNPSFRNNVKFFLERTGLYRSLVRFKKLQLKD